MRPCSLVDSYRRFPTIWCRLLPLPSGWKEKFFRYAVRPTQPPKGKVSHSTRLQVINVVFLSTFFFGATAPPPPQWVRASSFFRSLDYTQWCTTFGRTPLDEWSARRRDLYLTTHNTHNRQTSMPPVGFEPTVSTGERPQTYDLDRATAGTGSSLLLGYLNTSEMKWNRNSNNIYKHHPCCYETYNVPLTKSSLLALAPRRLWCGAPPLVRFAVHRCARQGAGQARLYSIIIFTFICQYLIPL